MSEIRSIVSSNVTFMAMTATASKVLRQKATEVIGLVNPKVIAVSPCKENIMYTVSDFVFIDESFATLLEELKSKLTLMDRTIIYCRGLNYCSDLYRYFKVGLGDKFTYPCDAPAELSKYRLVEMFTRCTDNEVKKQIFASFGSLTSLLRIVCATIAFGMGVDTPDVHKIIHYGPPNDIHSYIQETGRGGRDGNYIVATLLRVN